eukprot:CAMPEP_0194335852 /NCGR_PEP_ID=MMETSP0171-20130528/70987_1 /TAXON_ID=218684 /ORGANISM="Corethron pennatum, Strain L29A3" /LENGTH=44 /DNA_ID= /DNA_START= /DNA_END= /DNA_ORIENTATION=
MTPASPNLAYPPSSSPNSAPPPTTSIPGDEPAPVGDLGAGAGIF